MEIVLLMYFGWLMWLSWRIVVSKKSADGFRIIGVLSMLNGFLFVLGVVTPALTRDAGVAWTSLAVMVWSGGLGLLVFGPVLVGYCFRSHKR